MAWTQHSLFESLNSEITHKKINEIKHFKETVYQKANSKTNVLIN